MISPVPQRKQVAHLCHWCGRVVVTWEDVPLPIRPRHWHLIGKHKCCDRCWNSANRDTDE